MACLWPVMAGRQLDECRPELATDPLRFAHQRASHAALPAPRIDHERQDANDRVVVLETRHRVHRDEPEDRAIMFGHDAARPGGPEPCESGRAFAPTAARSPSPEK